MPACSRLARLLRFVCALQLAAVIGVLVWQWPSSPAQAVLGAALIACIAPIVLAIEFLLLARVARGDPAVPVATSRALLRAWLGEVQNLVRVFYWRLPFRWRSPEDHLDPACAGRTGVVLVHGFVCNRGFWAPWLRQLRARGHAHMAVNLEPVFGSIDAYAPIIAAAVQRVAALTGEPPVLVCHSMGGLAARAWLRTAGAPAAVARVITIGSPHHGTWLGRFSSMPNGRQMRQGSDWLADLERSEATRVLPPFTCWYANCDNIVFPPSTAMLPHADNRFLPGVAHVGMAFHPRLVSDCLALLAAPAEPK